MRSLSGATREAIKGYAFISPWVVGFLAFTLIPVGLSLYYSFCDYSLLQPPIFRGLENYRRLATDAVFWQSFGRTFHYAALSLPLCLAIALCAALLLNTRIRGQAVYRTIIFLPSIVPAVAAAMIWLWLFNAKLGLVNVSLRLIGVKDAPGWLGSEQWALPALVVISIWGVGNTVVIYLAGLQDVPKDLYDAADLDGAGAWGKVRHVTIPMLSPVIFFNLIVAIIGTMQIFVLPFIMTKGGPARATYFFTHYMYDNAFVYLRMGYASAMAWVQLIIVLAMTALAFWSGKRWVHLSGDVK
jgi:multiple sugar transport system permease protein